MNGQEIKLIINGKEVMIDAIEYYRILADLIAITYETLGSFYFAFKFQEYMDTKYLKMSIEAMERDMGHLHILL